MAPTKAQFVDSLHALQATRDEIIGDAGRYWQECEYTMKTVREIEADIVQLRRQATRHGFEI